MGVLNIEYLTQYMYDLLPQLYHQSDTDIKNKWGEDKPLLQSYYESMMLGTTSDEGKYSEGAGETLLNYANAFTDIVDTDKCPDSLFKYLYESFGFNLDTSIETREDGTFKIMYHRKFLRNMGDLIDRFGSITCLRFIVRVVTGLEFKYTYKRGIKNGKYGRYLMLNLIVDETSDTYNFEEIKKRLEGFLKPFIPYYITLSFGEYLASSESQFIAQPMHTVESYEFNYTFGIIPLGLSDEQFTTDFTNPSIVEAQDLEYGVLGEVDLKLDINDYDFKFTDNGVINEITDITATLNDVVDTDTLIVNSENSGFGRFKLNSK